MMLREAIQKVPREQSGSKTSNRFEFQEDWALLKLMELHETWSDYVMVFDYHDDILIMKNELSPTAMTFYQLKSKGSGNWTLAKLTSRQEAKGETNLLSIFGEMYNCKLTFPSNEVELNFVSNAKFNLVTRP